MLVKMAREGFKMSIGKNIRRIGGKIWRTLVNDLGDIPFGGFNTVTGESDFCENRSWSRADGKRAKHGKDNRYQRAR